MTPDKDSPRKNLDDIFYATTNNVPPIRNYLIHPKRQLKTITKDQKIPIMINLMLIKILNMKNTRKNRLIKTNNIFLPKTKNHHLPKTRNHHLPLKVIKFLNKEKLIKHLMLLN